jgi:hypothetical protein
MYRSINRNINSTLRKKYPNLYRKFHAMHSRIISEKCYIDNNIAVEEIWNRKTGLFAFITWSLSVGCDNFLAAWLSLDRVDSSKNYGPENCQYITREENTTNANIKRWQR